MLLFAIGFNLWLYRAEPTATVDPNDNAFQYALVDRTNQIWDYADRVCPSNLSHAHCLLSYLIDHWVPNWAEGYNLPYYYSHVPQIIIVGTYRLFSPLLSTMNHELSTFSLFQYYHWIIYLLLCFFPLSVFLSLRLLKQPWLTTGIGALLASQISTDGFYGIDPSSFLWRGWGLSSQLFAMIWMPLALVYSIRWICDENAMGKQFFEELKICLKRLLKKNHGANLHLARGKVLQDSDVLNRASSKNSFSNRRSLDFLYAIIFITATTAGHLGLGLMLFLAIPIIAFTKPVLTLLENSRLSLEEIRESFLKTVFLALPPLVLLSYWIVPTVLDGAFHNVSFWDPVWKFNSYGAKEILINLFNGSLFDWERLPIYTALIFIGCFSSFFLYDRQVTMSKGQGNSSDAHCLMSQHSFITPLPLLFLFFLLLYFGKTTWGGLLDFIPGMSEFHQHRFIVGVHLIGLFLAPIGFMWIVEQFVQFFRIMKNELRIREKMHYSLFFIPYSSVIIIVIFSIAICFLTYPQTIRYGEYNQTLIEKANMTFAAQKADAELLISTLKTLIQKNPGRVFAGRGGTWGKNFQVAETPYFMYLSTYGIPTVLWLPQTWSNNSDTEQYFSEDNQSHYDLYNIAYVVAPVEQKSQSFWTLIKETEHWKLYDVTQKKTGDNEPAPTRISSDRGEQETESKKQKTTTTPSSTNITTDKQELGTKNQELITTTYISAGVSPSVVFSDKLSFGNVVRLWIQSDYPKKQLFPELNLTYSKSSASQGEALRSYFQLPHFSMLDEAMYKTPDGKTRSLFAEPPVYMSAWEQKTENREQRTEIPITILNQSNDTDMVFKATVKISPSDKRICPTCVVVLKQTYHPNWKATVYKKVNQDRSGEFAESTTVNGKLVQTINVFPSYVGVRLEEQGEYEVVFTYTPSTFKMFLLFAGMGSVIFLWYIFMRKK